MNHENDFIVKHNEFTAEHAIENEISQLIIQIQALKRYSWTPETVKQMNNINLFLTCHKTYQFIHKEKYKTAVRKQ